MKRTQTNGLDAAPQPSMTDPAALPQASTAAVPDQPIAVAPVAGGWSVAVRGRLEPAMFLSRGRAEEHARRLADGLAAAGCDVRVKVHDMANTLTRTFRRFADPRAAQRGAGRAGGKGTLASAALLSLMLSVGVAVAQSAPHGVGVANGAMTDPAGKPLYTYDNDTMKGMSHCGDDCAEAWPPFLAPTGAKPVGDWTIITREDGSHQWAYKDKPLYSFSKDSPGKPGVGEAAGRFKLAR